MARSTVAASGGGLSIDTPIVTVVPDVSSFNAKAQEILEVAPDASPTSIETAPVTYLTDCSTQVFTVVSVNEVHGAATTVCPEPAVNLNHKEVAQLTPVQATPPIGISTSSLAKVVPLVTTTTDTVPSVAMAAKTVAMAAKPAPTRCLAEFPAHASDWVKPLIVTTERLHPSSFEHQPWPPHVQVQFSHMGHLFRPSPWPSFKPPSDANYQEEPCSGIHSQPYDISWFSYGLVLLLFRDEDFIPISCCELIPMEETFSLQAVEIWQSIPDDPRLLLWPPTSPENCGNRVVKEKLGNGGYTVHPTVEAMKLQTTERLCFLLPPAKPPDYQPRIWRKLREQMLHTQLQTLLVALVELQPWPSWKFQLPILSVMTSALKKCDCQHLLSAEACNLLLDKGSLKCHTVHREIDLKMLQPSGMADSDTLSLSGYSMWSELPTGELPTDYCYSTVRNMGSHVPISVDDFGSVKFIEHQFLAVHEQGSQWAWCFCLEKLWSIRYLACKSQEQEKCYEHQVHEHATVCSTYRPDKLQRTLRIRSMSVQWPLLSLEEFQGSGHLTRDCSSEQYGDPCVLLACLMVQPIISRQMQGITLASCPRTNVTKLCQVQLFLLGNKYSGRFEPETMHLFSYKPITDEPSALITTRARFCATFRNAKRLQGADVTNQQQHISTYPWNLSCWNERRSLLLIHASLGDFYRLLWDVSITAVPVQDVDRGVFFTGIITSGSITFMKYLWRECAIEAMNMPLPITLPSYLCPAGSSSTGFCRRHFATANPISLLHVGDWVAHLLGSTSASGYHLEKLWDPGGLPSYLCSTRALTFPMHYLYEVWIACVLSICIQMRMQKPMASGELNQWIPIIFLLGTLELDCSHDKLIMLLGFLPTFCCQSCQSTRSGKICVLGALDDPGSLTAVQGGYGISASNQENFQGGRGFIVVTAVFAQGIIKRKYYLGFDHDNTDAYTLGAFCDGVATGHDFCTYLVEVYPDFGYHHDSDQAKERQVPWDPGGSRWRRLGVKPSFKEGGMLGASCNHARTWAYPGTSHGPGPAVHCCCRLQIPEEKAVWRHPEGSGKAWHRRLSSLSPFFFL